MEISDSWKESSHVELSTLTFRQGPWLPSFEQLHIRFPLQIWEHWQQDEKKHWKTELVETNAHIIGRMNKLDVWFLLWDAGGSTISFLSTFKRELKNLEVKPINLHDLDLNLNALQ